MFNALTRIYAIIISGLGTIAPTLYPPSERIEKPFALFVLFESPWDVEDGMKR
ncbi:hypothetical protein IPA_03465 [Ignicoccus pacificus DSM 13166]|uniref:Uncharacterized protein n=1 Tax=Ignicoccus pacificus DSM 13166 TaxID=940294 RepID=A0A977KAZ3_9CREN|nr:hypothetical protein IPA_03465 [Ignicoccus pacificus DSM 13166]